MTGLRDKLTRQTGLLLIILGLIVLLVAAACGGGGDNVKDDETTIVDDALNHPPTADFIFDPQAVPRGDNFETVVTFSATGSDADGDSLTYSWTFQRGRPTTAVTQVAVATFPGAAPYKVTLRVSDGRGGEFTVTKVVPLE